MDPERASKGAATRIGNDPHMKDAEYESFLSATFRITRNLLRSWPAAVSLLILLGVIGLTIFAPWVTSYDPTRGNLRERLQAPTVEHLLGTDEQGRDMLTRIIFGGRIALMVGVFALLIGLVVGVTMGLLSGYYGGWIDTIIMRFTDLLLAFPYILLVIAIVSILGPDIFNAMIAIGVRIIPEFARLVRSIVLSIRSKEYVLSARSVGASDLRIIIRHVLPNCTAPIIVTSTLLLAGAILAEASLSFLGLGAQPPDPSWGTMVARGRDYLVTHPHLSIAPGMAILIVVYSLNVFGDWLRDLLDPQTE